MPEDRISCRQFSSYLLSQTPYFDEEILKDMHPTDGGLLGYYNTGPWDAFTEATHTQDRFTQVQPDLTKPWSRFNAEACASTPCDPDRNAIGWGWERETYFRETQGWKTNLLCFRQITTKTKAKEHVSHIISDVLKPATSRIQSEFLMRRAVESAGKKILATNVPSTLPDFLFTWEAGGYQYMRVTLSDGTTPADPISIMTPSMLQSRIRPLNFQGATVRREGAYDTVQFHTDDDTIRLLAREDPYLKAQWRFEMFSTAAEQFYKYGLSASLGDYLAKSLMFPMRFNRVAAGRYQRVLPYKNVATTEGIRAIPNDDYNRAKYQFSLSNHPRAIKLLTYKDEVVNPSMPHLIRDFGGSWNFAIHDLGSDCNGRAIENMAQDKGIMFADFDLSIKPEHTEWLDAWFHLVDTPCIVMISACNTDPGYPAQSYDSANALCPTEIQFVAEAKAGGGYGIAANGLSCNGQIITHAAISGADIDLFITDINSKWDTAGKSGTWTKVTLSDGTQGIQLTYAPTDTGVCTDVQFYWAT